METIPTVVHRFSTRVVERYNVTKRNMHGWYIIQHGDVVDTGSTYSVVREQRSDAFLTGIPILMRTPKRVEH